MTEHGSPCLMLFAVASCSCKSPSALLGVDLQSALVAVEATRAVGLLTGFSQHSAHSWHSPKKVLLTMTVNSVHPAHWCCMQVNRRKKIIITPRAPQFEVSPRLPVKIGPAEHTVVYGPYRSDRNELSLFPYASKAGNSFYNKGYDFFLASNSRVMNPLYQPKTSDNRDVRKDYYSKQRSQNQKSGGSLQSMLLEEMCGVKLSDVPEHFEQLKDLLNDLRVGVLPPQLLVYFLVSAYQPLFLLEVLHPTTFSLPSPPNSPPSSTRCSHQNPSARVAQRQAQPHVASKHFCSHHCCI